MRKNTSVHVMLIEDEEFDVRRVRNTFKYFEQNIIIKEVVSNGHAALEILSARTAEFDIIIMDYQIAGGLRGEELIKRIKAIDPSFQIIVITKLTINLTDFDFARSLMQAGAFWYCTKYPGDIEEYIYQPTDFTMSVFNAYEKRVLERERNRSEMKLAQTIDDILARKRIVAQAPSMLKMIEQIGKYAESEVSLLITGESGTGKELVANHIHYRSRRKYESFIPINCGGIPNELIESELFGYEKGSFTGATASKLGLLELAHNGTLFLDEVGELPMPAQVKLLRFLQEGEIEKIGRTKKIKVDVRIIAATNKDLEKAIQEKRFREDLYYRLNVVPIHIPPLRERHEDIELLIEHYVAFYSGDMGMEPMEIERSAMDVLREHPWPGNVRELKNVVQRLLFYSTEKISIAEVDAALLKKSDASEIPTKFVKEEKFEQILPLRVVEREFREKYFRFVRDNSESDSEAAKKLGLAPPNYHRMCKELGLKQ